MRDKLNAMMEFDTIVRVYDSGEVNQQHYGGVWAPEFTLETDADGSLIAGWNHELRRQAKAQSWSLMAGYSGAHMQGRSVLMDQAEFIGGRMADDILGTPGLYVAVVVSLSDSEHDAGWAVAYRHERADGTVDSGNDPSRWQA